MAFEYGRYDGSISFIAVCGSMCAEFIYELFLRSAQLQVSLSMIIMSVSQRRSELIFTTAAMEPVRAASIRSVLFLAKNAATAGCSAKVDGLEVGCEDGQ